MADSLVVVISGPGGVGKSTVVSSLLEKHPELWLSKSWTTRERRDGESQDAYNFVTRAEFEKHIASGGFLEHTEFLGNYYGTPIPKTEANRDLVLEIEVDGARQVKQANEHALLIFLEAPSPDEQLKRLNARGDSAEKIQERIDKSAEEQTAGRELQAVIVVNDQIDATVETIWHAIESYKAQNDSAGIVSPPEDI